VFCLSVASSSCLSSQPAFLILLVLDPCLIFDPGPTHLTTLPSPEPACLPSCIFAPPLDYWPLPDLTLSLSSVVFLWPCGCNKHCYFDTVCIWVLPWFLILSLFCKTIFGSWSNMLVANSIEST
jgi:hypothetical protein